MITVKKRFEKGGKYRIQKFAAGGLVPPTGLPEEPPTQEYPQNWWEGLKSKASNIYNWKENLSENINPYGYGKQGTAHSPFNRLYRAVVLDKPEAGRGEMAFINKGAGQDSEKQENFEEKYVWVMVELENTENIQEEEVLPEVSIITEFISINTIQVISERSE
jgi:hypothetical protein